MINRIRGSVLSVRTEIGNDIRGEKNEKENLETYISAVVLCGVAL